MTLTTLPDAALEPCCRCGQETAAGGPFFFDRHECVLADGAREFLCSECIESMRVPGRRDRHSDVVYTPTSPWAAWFQGPDYHRDAI